MFKNNYNNNTKNNKKYKFDIICIFQECKKVQEKSMPILRFLNYVEYTILVKTNKRIWEIKKRYSDFHNLNSTLKKNNTKNLPKLPKKAIFNSEKIIKERKIKLQRYLNNLLLRDDIYSLDSIFDFIELRKEDFLLMKTNLEEKEDCRNSPFSSTTCSMCINFKSLIEQKTKDHTIIDNNFYYSSFNLNDLNEEENKKNENSTIKESVNLFINELNSKKNYNKTELIEKFKENFFDNSKKIPGLFFLNEDIYKILFGERATKKSGLIFHGGDITNNIYGAEKCIEFLSNLLDYEYNLESENFANILKIGKLEIFKQMNLKYHLTSGKPYLFSCCCRIIRIILNEEKQINLKNLLNNDRILEAKVNNYIFNQEIMENSI